MGYKFQFITLAGFHSLELLDVHTSPTAIAQSQMSAYVGAAAGRVRRPRRTATPPIKHQREVGTGYFDDVTQTVTRRPVVGDRRWKDSTEKQQFAVG
jgi:isocitrate lyase